VKNHRLHPNGTPSSVDGWATSGEAVGTARYFYKYQQDSCIEILLLEMEVASDGQIYGKGRWQFGVVGFGAYQGEGVVTGNLNADDLTGNGRLTIHEEEGYLDINWEVTKEAS